MSHARRECDPSNFTDPAELREKPLEEELEQEYLIYGTFTREDRPDGAFLSKRWLALDDLYEHVGAGLVQTKIGEWETAKVTRRERKVAQIFEVAESEAEQGAWVTAPAWNPAARESPRKRSSDSPASTCRAWRRTPVTPSPAAVWSTGRQAASPTVSHTAASSCRPGQDANAASNPGSSTR